MTEINLSDYLLLRLKELGIDEIFGVPGDYNLLFLDHVANFKGLKWVGACNELNAAYAADGYARVKGAAAVVTTFGVGELSAINGIAGSYSEYIPVVKIVGAPSLVTQANKALVHHTFASGDFTVFEKMYKQVTEAQAILRKENATAEIDRVLRQCWIKKRPVYISLPSDLVNFKVLAPTSMMNLTYPESNQDAIKELVSRIAKLLGEASRPVVLLDICAVRHPMKRFIDDFLRKSGLPFATMNMGKGVFNESHAQFIGNYNGDFSSPGVQECVEKSDCIISFGTIFSDFNTGGFTANINANASFEIHSNFVKIKQSLYNDVYFDQVIPVLTQAVNSRVSEIKKPAEQPNYQATKAVITQKRFWQRMTHFFNEKDVIIGETGTSQWGLFETQLPDNATFICQTLWGSIGYSVGALLGAAMAAKGRRTLLFVGDGSFQLTAQEISSVMRHHLNPIVFLINNDGYTIERVIHGPAMEYNDVQMWNYASLPQIFGDAVWSAKVTTEAELEKILVDIPNHADKLVFIEVIMDKMDCPESLRKVAEVAARLNRGE